MYEPKSLSPLPKHVIPPDLICVNDMIKVYQKDINDKWKQSQMIQMRLDEKLSLSYVIDRSEFFGIGTNLYSVTSYLFKLMNYIQNNDQYFNESL